MRKSPVIIIVGILLIVSMLLMSCTSGESTSTTNNPASTSVTNTTGDNWWDAFGEPQYGGTITVRANSLESVSFDNGNSMGGQYANYFENLIEADWTLAPEVYTPMKGALIPLEYWSSGLIEKWEQTDLQTVTLYLNKGIHWQDKEPTNGREFTSDDVVYSYDYILGTGHGFTSSNPMLSSWIPNTKQVVAVDDYTVKFLFKEPSALNIFDISQSMSIMAPEAAGSNDWEMGTGTGAWILTEYVPSVSLTYEKNPDYYGYDAQHPENKLPYADSFKYLAIGDDSTALSALRTNKLDVINDSSGGLSFSEAASLAKSNPEIRQSIMYGEGLSLIPRVDNAPFTDIRVRTAMQMAVDLPTIAKVHYGGVIDGTPCGIIDASNTGWSVAFSEWPEELQKEYTYDVDAAKSLLAEAGFPDGFETNIVANTTQDVELLQILKSELNEIGIDMTINVMDMPAMMPYIFASKQDQMTYFGFSGRTTYPWVGLGIFTSADNKNFGHVADADYEALVKQIKTAVTIEDAQTYAKQAYMYALEQHWTVNTFSVPHILPSQPYIIGCNAQQGGYYIAHWWIDQSLKDQYAK